MIMRMRMYMIVRMIVIVFIKKLVSGFAARIAATCCTHNFIVYIFIKILIIRGSPLERGGDRMCCGRGVFAACSLTHPSTPLKRGTALTVAFNSLYSLFFNR